MKKVKFSGSKELINFAIDKLQMKDMIKKLAIMNMGDPAEVTFLLRDSSNKAKIIKEISDIDGKKVEEENTHYQNEVIRKLNNK